MLLISIICSLSFIGNGQVQLKNTSLINPDLNLLYIGVDNRIEVAGLERLQRVHIISSGNLDIWRPARDNRFVVNARNVGLDTISVYYEGKMVLTKIFQIRKINDPKLQLGLVVEKNASVRQILLDARIRLIIPDCNYRSEFMILSFQLDVKKSGNGYREFDVVSGSEWTEEQISLIKKLHPGDQIFVSDVKVSFKEGCVRTLSLPKITIR